MIEILCISFFAVLSFMMWDKLLIQQVQILENQLLIEKLKDELEKQNGNFERCACEKAEKNS